MVEYLDKNVGRLVNAVDELGLSDDTIIIFCADNGTHGPVTSVWGENRTRIKGRQDDDDRPGLAGALDRELAGDNQTGNAV